MKHQCDFKKFTAAVATCPSVSTRSIVPVGKYGRINVKERVRYLKRNPNVIK